MLQGNGFPIVMHKVALVAGQGGSVKEDLERLWECQQMELWSWAGIPYSVQETAAESQAEGAYETRPKLVHLLSHRRPCSNKRPSASGQRLQLPRWCRHLIMYFCPHPDRHTHDATQDQINPSVSRRPSVTA